MKSEYTERGRAFTIWTSEKALLCNTCEEANREDSIAVDRLIKASPELQGGVAGPLKAIAALAEDAGLILRSHVVARNHLALQLRRTSFSLLASLGSRHEYHGQTCMHASKTPVHVKYNKKIPNM